MQIERFALTEQSALGSLECEHSDSASLDYVASAQTGRAMLKHQTIQKQKRDNREGYLSFVGGASFMKVEPIKISKFFRLK